MVSAGLYLGQGVMSLPQKLLTQITNLDFVEMQELLPEAWLQLGEVDHSSCCSDEEEKASRNKHLYVAHIPSQCIIRQRPLTPTRTNRGT